MNFSSASFYFSPKLKALSCDTRRAVCLRSFLLSPFFFHSFTSATSVLPSFHPNFLMSLSFLNFSSFLEASFHPSLWLSSSNNPSFCPCSVNPSFFLSLSFFTLCPLHLSMLLSFLVLILFFTSFFQPFLISFFVLFCTVFPSPFLSFTLLSRCLSSFLSLSRSQRSEASRRQTEKHFTQSQISDISETPPAVVLSALKHRHRGIGTSSRCVYTAVRLQIR